MATRPVPLSVKVFGPISSQIKISRWQRPDKKKTTEMVASVTHKTTTNRISNENNCISDKTPDFTLGTCVDPGDRSASKMLQT